MRPFWLSFIALFVAVDAIGTVPVYLGLTEGMARNRVPKVLTQSVLTALGVSLAFLGGGKALLALLGITVADFMIAGGIILFTFSLGEMLSPGNHADVDREHVGAVPIGVPLIAGPAVLATVLLLADAHGVWPAVWAVVANVVLAGLILRASSSLFRSLGGAGVKTVSKISHVLLCAYAVMMVRKGILFYVTGAAM